MALTAAAAAQEGLDAEAYRSLVARAERGSLRVLGRELAGHRHEDLDQAVSEFLRDGPTAAPLMRAALLHTEAALGLRHASAAHLALATRLSGALPRTPASEDWRRRWFLAVAYSYHHAINPLAAETFLDSALETLPGDREIRLALARVLHMGGRLRGEQRLQIRTEEVLRDLLRESPGDPELRVRLASVLADLDRTEEAVAELASVDGERMGPLVRFALHLVRGEIALKADEFATAEQEFVRALRRGRTSLGATAGLVAARMALRDGAGAAEAAGALLDRRAVGWEPEWQFWLGPARELDEAFDALRAEAQGQPAEKARP